MKTTTSTPQLTNPEEPKNPRLETVDCLGARLVELELLEQALNAGRDLKWFLDWRLKDLTERRKGAPQPANPLPSQEDIDPDIRKLVNDNFNKLLWTDKPTPTTPIETNPVNAWMLANGWEWLDNKADLNGVWYKEPFAVVDQDLAAEMYRMSEERVAEARADELNRLPTVKLDSPHEHKSRKFRDFGKFLHDVYLPKRLAQLAATNPRKEA